MIFAASCMLNASPGPMPGAPLKSPMVSRTVPSPLTGTVVFVSSQIAEGARGWPKGIGIDPLYARASGFSALNDISRKGMIDRVVSVALEGVPDRILKRQSDIPRLAGMEIPEATDLPSVH